MWIDFEERWRKKQKMQFSKSIWSEDRGAQNFEEDGDILKVERSRLENCNFNKFGTLASFWGPWRRFLKFWWESVLPPYFKYYQKIIFFSRSKLCELAYFHPFHLTAQCTFKGKRCSGNKNMTLISRFWRKGLFWKKFRQFDNFDKDQEFLTILTKPRIF